MDFLERMQSAMSQGWEATRKGVEQAAEKAREMGEKGVLRYEIGRLEKEVERKFALLGSNVYQAFVKKVENNIAKTAVDVKDLLSEVQDLEKRISEKEKAIEKIGNES